MTKEKTKMTLMELDYFSVFLKRLGETIRRSQFENLHRDWPSSNAVDVHMRNLRRKLEERGEYVIETVRGEGYKMNKI